MNQLEKITIPDDWAENMLAQIEMWGKQTEKEMRSFVQNTERSIKETEQKLDKLVTSFLDGLLEKDEYLKRKEELIKTKVDLNKRKEDFLLPSTLPALELLYRTPDVQVYSHRQQNQNPPTVQLTTIRLIKIILKNAIAKDPR